MATITDPDFLFDNATDSAGANIYIDTALRTIKIRNNSAAPKGPVLDNTGVSLQALYSFLKEEWKDDPNNKSLIAYPFPLIAITPEQFEWRFGWSPADDSSRNLLRTAGWREFAVDNSTQTREYLGVITLGNIDGDQNQDNVGDQDVAYYAFFDSATLAPKTAALDFDFPGPVNQAIQTYLDANADGTPDFDRRSDIVTVFIRQEGKTYGQTRTTEIGLPAGTTLPYNVQRFPLAEGTDLDATVSDATIIANSNTGQKYDSADDNGPTIRFLSEAVTSDTLGYTKDLAGAGGYSFGILINADDGAAADNLAKQELYSWVQYSLRRNVNIEDSAGASKVGKLTDELLEFVGPTLKTKTATNLDGGGIGVAITNFLSTDVNDLAFRDNSGTERTFPFTAAGTISFSDEILSDAENAKFFVYYDYTKSYEGTIAISSAGTASDDANVDSAVFTLSGFTVNPVTTGVNGVTLGSGDYFRLTGASNANNNQIWQITSKSGISGTGFSAITYDDTPAVDATAFSGSIRTHPLNSPQAVLVDSAGAVTENTGGITATLAAGNLNGQSQFVFEYDYDGNTQFDREAGTNAAIVIRALGLNNGSFVELAGQTIAQSTTNSYSVISAVERNYSNP